MLAIVIVAVAVAVIGIGVILSTLLTGGGGGGASRHEVPEDIVARERIFARAATRILGRYLADLAPGAEALVVVEETPPPVMMEPLLEGLRDGLAEGLGAAVTVTAVVAPDLSAADAATLAEAASDDFGNALEPVAERIRAWHFDAMIAAHPECGVVVSFLGMPLDFSDMSLWAASPESRPVMAVAQGHVPMLANALLSDAVSAVVLPHPDPIRDEVAPSLDPQEAFDCRYLLATPENVEELAAHYPNLFEE